MKEYNITYLNNKTQGLICPKIKIINVSNIYIYFYINRAEDDTALIPEKNSEESGSTSTILQKNDKGNEEFTIHTNIRPKKEPAFLKLSMQNYYQRHPPLWQMPPYPLTPLPYMYYPYYSQDESNYLM